MNTESTLNRHWKIILGAIVVSGIAGGALYYLSKPSPAKVETPKPKKKNKKKKSDASKSKDLGEQQPIESNKDVKVLAQEAKAAGNKLYAAKKFNEAIEQYTKAIALHTDAVFYCNRAASYSNIQEYQLAINDCNEAIKLDKAYIKAFHRRALAFEKLGNLKDALNDYTVVCVLESFQNQNSMAAPDRLLKVISTQRTEEIMKSKVTTMPSQTFISAYMDSFRATPSDAQIVLDLESETESDLLLKKTFTAYTKREWQTSFDLVNLAIKEDKFSDKLIKAKAYNYRATLHFLMGLVNEAVEDLEKSLELDPKNVNSIIKRATLYMERGEVEKTIQQFEKAESVTKEHPDLFYHRGQVRFLTGDFEGAVQDYSNSLKYEKENESSVYVHIQMGVAKYKLGDLVGSDAKFKEAKKLFPKSAEVWNYHGEILMDKQNFADAEKSFLKAIEMDPKSPLPYINMAILLLQWKNDGDGSEAQCKKAIEVDPLCDIAYTQLAQLLCHQNKMDEALRVYNDAIKIARTEAEVMNIISCQEAAAAQAHVMKNFPEAMAKLRQ
ncbi:hypothetical protein BC833DRAFT_580978 [Globomyces pollinis-pini]|nr:hypothetical protein BC833DRAFT_580978 [Globomyces pollinis-pini]